MDDLAQKLQSILSTPEGQEQLRNIQAMLGMSDAGSSGSGPDPQPPASNGGSGLDFSGLLNALGGNGGAPAPQAQGGGPDLSGLASMLGGLAGGGGAAPANAVPGMPPIDMNTILKLQKVFQSMNVNDKNSQLLLALKPHFGEHRRQKVDQAISMMRLFSMLPALRESGIFSGL